MSFRILTATRLELLFDHLAADLATAPLEDPFAEETVLVQSGGMRRWLRLSLADRLGISAGLHLPAAGAFLRELAATEGEELDPDALAWWLFGRLEDPDRLPGPPDEQAVLAGYLADDPRQLKRHGLAVRLAALFDEYQLYRPELLAGWSREPAQLAGLPHEAWQASLWQDFRAAHELPPVPPLLRLRDALRAGVADFRGKLPRRLAVFGIATLPPLLIELLRLLGEATGTAITVYSLSPTAATAFWFEEEGERERRVRELAEGLDGGFILPGTTGDELLILWGRQGHDFARLLADADTWGGATDDLDALGVTPLADASAAEPPHLLAAVQHGIRHLEDPPDPAMAPGDDASITFHRCHSPAREVEVLRDALLDALETEHDLRPHDILVAVPDIELYAPHIDAVFGLPREDGTRLMYTVGDRAVPERSSLAAAFLGLLELARGRRGLSEILALLECPALRRGSGLGEDQLDTVALRLRAAGIRWGADADQREAVSGYRGEDNTWRQGLRRLLLGYACGPDAAPVAGLVPEAGDTVGDAALLGKVTAFVEELFAFLDACERPLPGRHWRRLLSRARRRLFRPEGDEELEAAVLVDGALDGLPDDDLVLDVEVVHRALAASLGDEGHASAFLRGGITFCALKPLRSIPFAVVALLGMGDGIFPRQASPPAFDLVAAAPALGDRDLRADDRYLFLEMVMAAGRRLHLSWVGRSIVDDAEREPSACVDELLQYLRRRWPARASSLVRDHHLQPWADAYYKVGSPLSSYDAEYTAAVGSGVSTPPFVAGDAPLPGEGDALPPGDPIALEDLVAGILDPVRRWCRIALDVDVGDDGAADDDDEVIEPDQLVGYLARDLLYRARVAGRSGADLCPVAVQRGILPHGAVGDLVLDGAGREVDAIVGRLADLGQDPAALAAVEPLAVRTAVAGQVVAGRCEGVTPAGPVACRVGQVRGKDRLAAWVRLVVLANALDGDDPRAACARLVGIDGTWTLTRPADPAGVLAGLLRIHRLAGSRPLPLFPEASRAWAEAAADGRDPAVEAARAWAKDARCPAVRIAFRDRDPLADPAFGAWAEALWGPLLAAQEAPP